jgi:hypothetical protein
MLRNRLKLVPGLYAASELNNEIIENRDFSLITTRLFNILFNALSQIKLKMVGFKWWF